ncbi:MAG: TldD/PmbA family protein [Lachnospirales bacterium]
MLSREQVNEILSTALFYGANFAEIFFEETEKHLVTLVNEKVDKSTSGIDKGIGIRVISNGKVIYTYTNKFDLEHLKDMSKKAALALENNQNGKMEVIPFVDFEKKENHNAKIITLNEHKKQGIEILKKGNLVSKQTSQFITETTAMYNYEVQNVLIANSEGLYKEDTRYYTRIGLSAIASDGKEKQVGTQMPGLHGGFEIFDEIDIEDLGHDCAKSASTMLSAGYMESGKIPVVLDNGFGGVIFHEACGHPLEAQFIAKDSPFSNKIGEKIANEKLSAVDDGTIKNAWGSLNIDDEGTKTKRNVLIENGILKGYLVDRVSGEKINMKSTGSGRRQNYKFAPTSRMNNTFILNGKDKRDDIFSSIEYGLYAKKMGGGSVDFTTAFNFSVVEGYVIRNGKICEPVRGATLIGKGSEILQKIDMISDNLSQAQGVCGSSSGQIPTNVGQPTLRVNEIVVGGR